MKYNCSIDEFLSSGFVVSVQSFPSWLDKLFRCRVDEKYVVCRDERNVICVQKVGSKQVFQLFEKSENGVWCSEIRRGEVGPSYRAPKVLSEVYNFAASRYASKFIEEISDILFEEIE